MEHLDVGNKAKRKSLNTSSPIRKLGLRGLSISLRKRIRDSFRYDKTERERELYEASLMLESLNETLCELSESLQNHKRIFSNTIKETGIDTSLSIESDVQTTNTTLTPKAHIVEMSHDLPWNPPRVSHDCQEECWVYGREYPGWQLCSPLDLPLKLGWRRIIKGLLSPEVYYIAPCGKEMKTMEEIFTFLHATKATTINISQFTMDPYIQLETNVVSQTLLIDDISGGKEDKPISCVNEVTSEEPEEFEYTAVRTHQPDVPLNTATNTMVSCNCTDRCRNRLKCACWGLTLKEAEMINSEYSVGYVDGRLRRYQHSAIYECNSNCKCGPQCANRVVQHGIVYRLQVFRSPVQQLQWGLRTLDDIPQGTFVCTYIGHIYTEAESDEQAQLHGDEYFAELDYIEIMQQHLNDPVTISPCSGCSSNSGHTPQHSSCCSSTTSLSSSALSSPIHIEDGLLLSDESITDDSDEEQFISNCDIQSPLIGLPQTLSYSIPYSLSEDPLPCSFPSKDVPHSTKSQQKADTCTSNDSIALHCHTWTSSHPYIHSLLEINPLTPPTTSSIHAIANNRIGHLRREGNGCYIMDAKLRGNVGRYINHSCSPNLFVQNVFIDTQDHRFPWVALFASRRIKALEELTWDYNYEVGSVSGRTILCLCGSEGCRGRLL